VCSRKVVVVVVVVDSSRRRRKRRRSRRRRRSYSCSLTGLKCLVRLQSCEKALGWCTALCKILLFCLKNHRERVMQFEEEEQAGM